MNPRRGLPCDGRAAELSCMSESGAQEQRSCVSEKEKDRYERVSTITSHEIPTGGSRAWLLDILEALPALPDASTVGHLHFPNLLGRHPFKQELNCSNILELKEVLYTLYTLCSTLFRIITTQHGWPRHQTSRPVGPRRLH